MALPTYDTSIITAVLRGQQNIAFPQFIMGGQGTGSEYALFKKTTTYDFTCWRSQVYQIGRHFDVLQIKFTIVPDMAANMTIIPVLYFDNEDSSSVGTTINYTNYPNANRLISLSSDTFGGAVHGKNNFFLELQFTGTALVAVGLPIAVDVEVEE